MAALAFLLMDANNELINSVILYYTRYSALWTECGPTAYQILVGWNIETLMMFALFGLASTRLLPQNKREKWFGINNRLVIGFVQSVLAVGVEVVLNRIDFLPWHYWWWSANFPFLILVFGYWHFHWVAFCNNERAQAGCAPKSADCCPCLPRLMCCAARRGLRHGQVLASGSSSAGACRQRSRSFTVSFSAVSEPTLCIPEHVVSIFRQ
jgi:hypothetical protein